MQALLVSAGNGHFPLGHRIRLYNRQQQPGLRGEPGIGQLLICGTDLLKSSAPASRSGRAMQTEPPLPPAARPSVPRVGGQGER